MEPRSDSTPCDYNNNEIGYEKNGVDSQGRVQIPAKTKDEIDVDSVYYRLIHEAPYIPGEEVGGSLNEYPSIEWIDSSLIKKGQKFVTVNFFSLICAHLGALLYGFSFKSLSTVLLRTGHSSDIQSSVIRYLSTFIHLKTWYESDITGEAEVGYRDIQRVKKMHVLALRKYKKVPESEDNALSLLEDWTQEKQDIVNALQQDLKCIEIYDVPHQLLTYTPDVPMSQFDMVMTQFGIISLVYLFPNTLGIKNKEGLDGFLHLWAVIGKILGIQDRFNLALFPNRELYMKIFTNIGVSSLKESDMTVVTLQKALIDGVAKYAYFTSVKSLLYYGLSMNDALPNFKGRNLAKIMSWEDKFYYWLMRVLLFSVYHFQLVRSGVNCTARLVLSLASRKYLKKGKKVKVPPQNQLGITNQIMFFTFFKNSFSLKKLGNYYSSSVIYNTIIFILYCTFCLFSLLIVCVRF